ncbi:Peptidase_C39 like family protein [Deinococcus reticulitermitis]|uniref:Peptidase_C39 like family protein n=1 Tax=Deinococcus reticulitermitis TaxID=856736 RepID=A0A1H6T7G8_9DEIO|nr:C39 family peptidase [Deinococcus reticulitermitis]SEI72230.1 Peptidase_C39 like family protein [Deinococcus reticulitermitis]
MRARLFSLLTALLLLAGFGQAAPAGYVLSGMPLVRQTYNACGPASIAQVLGYFGLEVSQGEISRLTRPNDRAYMTAQAIVDFAPLVGMEARLYAGGSLATVRAAIGRGLPLIALQSHIPEPGKVIPHWRVIVGYHDEDRQVYVMDPLLGYVALSYTDFNRVWADQRGQFAVLYPPALAATVKKVIG